MSDGTEDERMNSLVVEIRVLEGTYNELTSRQSLLERALLEGRSALEALAGLGEHPPGEVLTQIGGGAMLRGPAPATDRVLISIGANVVVEKPTDEAKALLEARSREVEKTVLSIANQRNEIAQRLDADRQLLQTYVGQQGQQSE